MGLPSPSDTDKMRMNLALFAGHVDGDLWPDIYVANTHCEPEDLSHLDVYYRNTGLGRFIDSTAQSPGIGDDSRNAMGVTVGDIDLDGDWDMYITDTWGELTDSPPVGNPLYVGNGDGTLGDNTAHLTGVQGKTSWPANFIDADQDRYEDLFVGVAGDPQGNNLMYRNNTDGTFTDVSAVAGVVGYPFTGARGSALLDFDRDGDLDIIVVNDNNVFVSMFRNDSENQGHWLQINLVGTVSNRDAIGALVTLESGSDRLMRQVAGISSAHSQDQHNLHFGLGDATAVDELTVFWPSGLVTRLESIAADQEITIVETEQNIRHYGESCDGGSGYAPSLLVDGAIQAGGFIRLKVVNSFGGGTSFLLLGTGEGQAPLIGGCKLNIAPLLPIYAPLPPNLGSGAGKGVFSVSLPLPAAGTVPGTTATLQAFVHDPGVPTLLTTTNGVRITVVP